MRRAIVSMAAASLLLGHTGLGRSQNQKKETSPAKEASTASTPSSIGGKTLHQWITEISDLDPANRVNAIQAVVMFGQGAQKQAGHALIGALTNSDPTVRHAAATAIGTIGLDEKDRQKGISALAGKLASDSQSSVKFQSALTLARFGPEARSALPTVISAMKESGSFEVRKACAFALANIGRGDKNMAPNSQAVNALTRSLGDSCSKVRQEVVMALLVLGPPGAISDRQAVLERLRAHTTDKDDAVAIWVHMAAMRMDKVNKSDINAIAHFLKSPKLTARISACEAIRRLAAGAKESIPDLVPHIPVLIESLGDREGDAAAAAANALVELADSVSAKQLDSIAKMLQDPDYHVRGQAALTLGMFRAYARAHVDKLVAALQDPDVNVVLAVISALTDMGEVARGAIPELTRLTQSKDENVRYAAMGAIDHITKGSAKPEPKKK